MPEAIESKSFRAAARKNCISYMGIPIYVQSTPDLQRLALPTFRAQSPDGAVSQLFSTLVNMNTQIEQLRKGLRMSDSKPVPGVSYNDIEGMQMSLNGAVYFETARQFNAFMSRIASIAKNYGWVENHSGSTGAAVYHPAQNSFVNNDPVQAAVKGFVMGAASEMMDAGTMFAATDAIEKGSEAEKKYFAARDRYEGGSIFDMAALQYYSNTPKAIQDKWSGMGGEMVPTLLVDGVGVFHANIAYMPSSVSVTPAAYVADSTGLYPSRCDVNIQMANPLGGLFANFTVAKEGTADAGSKNSVTPSGYLKGVLPY